MEGFALPSKIAKEDVDACFNEGENALYIVIQLICPECNKIVRLTFLADSKSMRTQ